MPVPKSHVSLTKRLRKTSERIREKTESNHRGTMAQKRVALRNPDSATRSFFQHMLMAFSCALENHAVDMMWTYALELWSFFFCRFDDTVK